MLITSQWAATRFVVNDYTPFWKFSLSRKSLILMTRTHVRWNSRMSSVSLPEGNNKYSLRSQGQFLKEWHRLPQKLTCLFFQLAIRPRTGWWCYLGILVLNVPAQPTLSKLSFFHSLPPSTKFTWKMIKNCQRKVPSLQVNALAILILPTHSSCMLALTV